MTPLAHLPPARRPREMLLEKGASSLCLEDLVAIVLGSGSKKLDALELSQAVAAQLVSGDYSVSKLMRIKGIGTSKATSILAALQLPAALSSRIASHYLCSAEEVYSRCADLLDTPQENVLVFYVSIRSRTIAREVISVGTATASLIHPREVFRSAISHNAASLVMAHTHPSGEPTPSQADLDCTREIVKAGRIVGISVLDHVICAANGFYSLALNAPELFN